MDIFFLAITHLLIVVGTGLLVYFTIQLITRAPSTGEKVVRLLALLAGFLSFVGARAIGMNVPDLLFRALQTTNPFRFGILELLLPGLVGAVVAWFLLRSVADREHEAMAFRLMILVTTFVLMLFAEIYAVSFTYASEATNAAHLLPNLSFAIGLSLYIVLRYKPWKRKGTEEEKDWRELV